MMNKKRNKEESLLKSFMLGIIAWICVSVIGAIMIISESYLLKIICIAILYSFLFNLFLYSCLKSFMNKDKQKKRRKVIFITGMSVEIILMIGLIIYASFTTLIIQECILQALALGGFLVLLVITYVADLLIKNKK